MANTLSVDLMYMYKEMTASLHTGVWEDICLLDKYSHWTKMSMTDRTRCVREHQCAMMLIFPCTILKSTLRVLTVVT